MMRELRAIDARGETRRDDPTRVVVGAGIVAPNVPVRAVIPALPDVAARAADVVARPLRATTRRDDAFVFAIVGIGLVLTTAFIGLVLWALASPGFNVVRI